MYKWSAKLDNHLRMRWEVWMHILRMCEGIVSLDEAHESDHGYYVVS